MKTLDTTKLFIQNILLSVSDVVAILTSDLLLDKKVAKPSPSMRCPKVSQGRGARSENQVTQCALKIVF